ncbi:hypothetical protein [Acinetobacter sp.]|uniref:hypothetical protein n=1 Tax=Acinetobacter sp. TaxID=472 RepID=UPI0039819AC4
MKYRDLLVKLNHVVMISDPFPSEALQLLEEIDVPQEFIPIVSALKGYIEFKESNIIDFLNNLSKDEEL